MIKLTGEELKEVRMKYGVTQAELAWELGYKTKGEANRSVISRWENGRQDISKRAQQALWGFFYMKSGNF